jgi:hypothetical protein
MARMKIPPKEWPVLLAANAERITARIARKAKRLKNGCLELRGANAQGYPLVSIKTSVGWRAIRINRAVLALAGRLDIADDSIGALHSCDNPRCIELAHLFPGTQKANLADASKKGRVKLPGLAGVAHPQAKLSAAQVRAIRRSSETHRELASRFGVSHFAIGRIKRNQQYKDL